MRSLVITKDNLDNQRNAVQEERRLGVDNQPYGKTFEALDELAYDNFAYEHSVIGSMADLERGDASTTSPTFFKTYYAPNNAVIGDRRRRRHQDGAREDCASTSSPIPSQPAPPAVDMTEPAQTEERRATLEDALARLPRLDMAYKIPPELVSGRRCAVGARPRSCRAAAARGSTKRSSGRSSCPTGVVGGAGESRAARRCSRSGGTPLPGKTLAELEAAIEEEIEKVKTGPIADWEMQKARNGARSSSFVSSLGSTLSRATAAVAVRDVLQQAGPDQHARGQRSPRSRPPTCSGSRSSIWSRPTARWCHTMPKAAAPEGRPVMSTTHPHDSSLAARRPASRWSRRRRRAAGTRARRPQGMVLEGQGAGLERGAEGQAAASRRRPTLPNGLHLMVLEDHRLPQVSFQIIIPGAGGYYDPADKIGLASTPRTMMREGTEDADDAADGAGARDAGRERAVQAPGCPRQNATIAAER